MARVEILARPILSCCSTFARHRNQVLLSLLAMKADACAFILEEDKNLIKALSFLANDSVGGKIMPDVSFKVIGLISPCSCVSVACRKVVTHLEVQAKKKFLSSANTSFI